MFAGDLKCEISVTYLLVARSADFPWLRTAEIAPGVINRKVEELLVKEAVASLKGLEVSEYVARLQQLAEGCFQNVRTRLSERKYEILIADLQFGSGISILPETAELPTEPELVG